MGNHVSPVAHGLWEGVLQVDHGSIGQDSPEKQNQQDIHERDLFKGIGSSSCEGASPNSAGWASRLETQGKSSLGPKGQLLEEFLLAQGRSVFGLSRPSTDWVRPTHIKSTDLNVNLIPKHLHGNI